MKQQLGLMDLLRYPVSVAVAPAMVVSVVVVVDVICPGELFTVLASLE